MSTMKEIKKTAKELYTYLQPFCISIYLGGSSCQKYIKNKHDIDFIFFVDKLVDMCHIRRLLHFYTKKHSIPSNYDFIQIRTKQKEEHSYGSYIHKDMLKLIGEDIEFKFDVIDKDREEYKQILINTIDKLETDKIRNKKRWYQVVRGYLILKNNTYDLSKKESDMLNLIHDQMPGWEKFKITTEQVEKL